MVNTFKVKYSLHNRKYLLNSMGISENLPVHLLHHVSNTWLFPMLYIPLHPVIECRFWNSIEFTGSSNQGTYIRVRNVYKLINYNHDLTTFDCCHYLSHAQITYTIISLPPISHPQPGKTLLCGLDTTNLSAKIIGKPLVFHHLV